jgi:hypothetical protein
MLPKQYIETYGLTKPLQLLWVSQALLGVMEPFDLLRDWIEHRTPLR